MTLLAYLGARLEERSTWAAIGAGLVGAAALAAPWSYVLAVVGIAGALTPTSVGAGE